jgi:membrane protease YdiL (CAAX protease family)
LRRLCRRHPIASFLTLAYVISWTAWVPFIVHGATVTRGDGWPTDLIGLLGPALAAVLVTGAAEGRAGLRDLWDRVTRWRVAPVWYVLIALTLAVGLGTALVRDGGRFDLGAAARYTGSPDLGLVLTFLLVLVVNGFGEETGWRGFLAERLLRRQGVLTTGLVVAVAWGGWHLPLFFLVSSFQGLGVAVVGWAVGLVCGSVVLTWMYAGASRSVFVVALWHTCFNFASGTALTDGLPAAVVSTAVMLLAAVIVCWSLVASRSAAGRRPARSRRPARQ